MRKAAVLAIPILASAHAALGMTRPAGPPPSAARATIHPVVVMFGLAIVRHHMLDTLVELIGEPDGRAPCRSMQSTAGLPPG